MGAPAPHQKPPDGRSAGRAGEAGLAVNLVPGLEGSAPPEALVIAGGGAPGGNGGSEDAP